MPFDAVNAVHVLKPGALACLQAAAIPLRWVKGAPQVLLVTTRGRGAWIVPKGWPTGDYPDCESARREAFEEAGVTGRIETSSLGAFEYWKGAGNKSCLLQAHAFALHVDEICTDWPERGMRKRCWFSPEDTLSLVRPDLGALILETAYGQREAAVASQTQRMLC